MPIVEDRHILFDKFVKTFSIFFKHFLDQAVHAVIIQLLSLNVTFLTELSHVLFACKHVNISLIKNNKKVQNIILRSNSKSLLLRV